MTNDWDIVYDKWVEYKEQLDAGQYEYCYHCCLEHNDKCPYYEVDIEEESESWDYRQCFEERGWEQ